jgi:dephospho-CoA kinase
MMSQAVSLELSKRLNNCRAIIVIGDTCVGKSYVAKHINQELINNSPFVFEYVEVSDVVKKLSKNPGKDGLDLLNTDELMIYIVDVVEKLKNVVLSGLREQKIFKMLKDNCKAVYTIKVTAPSETIAKRIYQRKDVDSVKVERDKQYDYTGIPIDYELSNTKEKSWTQVFWFEDFRKVVGLLV